MGSTEAVSHPHNGHLANHPQPGSDSQPASLLPAKDSLQGLTGISSATSACSNRPRSSSGTRELNHSSDVPAGTAGSSSSSPICDCSANTSSSAGTPANTVNGSDNSPRGSTEPEASMGVGGKGTTDSTADPDPDPGPCQVPPTETASLSSPSSPSPITTSTSSPLQPPSSLPSSSPSLPPKRAPSLALTVRDFEFLKLLGLGSFAKVVLARYKQDGKEYALKVMAKQLIIRERKVKGVKRERMILDQLDHPGIVRMCFTFQDQVSLYMAMECCHGGELYDQIRRRGRLPIEVARFYAAEVVSVLEYLHSRGVIHRDIKPENMLLTAEGHVKLADFGSATTFSVDDGLAGSEGAQTLPPVELPSEDETDERNGSFVGTAEYISPEVLESHPATYLSDLWALGCVIFHMLQGRPPFRGASEYLTFQKVLHRDFQFSDDCSHTIDEASKDLIGRLLALDPVQRIGAREQGGYEVLKGHPFFEGIDWSTSLWEQAPPSLAKPSLDVDNEMPGDADDDESDEDDDGSDDGSDDDENDENNEEDAGMDEEWKLAHLAAFSLK